MTATAAPKPAGVDKTTLTRINQTSLIAGNVFAGMLILAGDGLTAEQVAALRAASIGHADQIYKDTITHVIKGGS